MESRKPETTGEINWRDFPSPAMTGEQLEQFEEFILKSMNQVFEQDFENWAENYREANQGKS
jgi:hypothetical protein